MKKELRATSTQWIPFRYHSFESDTLVLDHITRSAYMLLSCASQNNEHDRGGLHVTMKVAAEIMRLPERLAWGALCRLAFCGNRTGGNLLELYVKRNGEFTRISDEEAVKTADTPPDGFTDLRVVITWVRDEENSILNDSKPGQE